MSGLDILCAATWQPEEGAAVALSPLASALLALSQESRIAPEDLFRALRGVPWRGKDLIARAATVADYVSCELEMLP
ncbi:MAG: hypothetical protein MRY63_04295 [Neomegalonema sp.]|nr:hypothetical protein [Neomegalonema sp.]